MADGGEGGEREVTMLSPGRIVPDDTAIISVLFDTSDYDACESLHELRTILQGQGDIEALDQDLFVLHIFHGSAWGPSS